MGKPDWGAKRTCTSCGARFYDLNHDPIVCPKCQTEQPRDLPTRSAVRRPKVGKAAPVAPVAVMPLPDEEVDDEDELEDEEEGDLMEDASDLGEDDEDMAEVMEHVEAEGEEEV